MGAFDGPATTPNVQMKALRAALRLDDLFELRTACMTGGNALSGENLIVR